MAKPDSVFVALINSENEVLTVRRSATVNKAGMWALPGGRQDDGEDIWKTGCREVFEEIGLLIDRMMAGHGKLHVVSGKTHVITVPWTPDSGQVGIMNHLINGNMASSEIDQVKWRTWSEACSMLGLHKSLDLWVNRVPASSVRLFEMLENRPL
jgi:8-oxo-dGTP pyrophosphatase MutT (NUDIX family)